MKFLHKKLRGSYVIEAAVLVPFIYVLMYLCVACIFLEYCDFLSVDEMLQEKMADNGYEVIDNTPIGQVWQLNKSGIENAWNKVSTSFEIEDEPCPYFRTKSVGQKDAYLENYWRITKHRLGMIYR